MTIRLTGAELKTHHEKVIQWSNKYREWAKQRYAAAMQAFMDINISPDTMRRENGSEACQRALVKFDNEFSQPEFPLIFQ